MAAFARNNQIVLLARDRAMVEPLRQALRVHGFAAISISEPAAALDALRTRPPDLVLLDWTLPVDVRECVHSQKARYGFYLFVLSAARSEREDLMRATCADAHVSPPLDVRDITARVQALLPRQAQSHAPILVSDDLSLDQGSRQVTVRGVHLPMSEVQFRLLECFLQHQRRLCPRVLLLRRVWSPGKQPAARTVDVNVQRLRQLLDAAGCSHRIETVRGGGYRLMPPNGSRPS